MSYQNINAPPQQGIPVPQQSGYSNPADMPLQNPKDQIALWQQGNYMTDSGIQSGATTQAPSVTGKDEEMDTVSDWVEGPSYGHGAYGPASESGYTSEQFDEIAHQLSQPRSQKMSEGPLTPYDTSMPTPAMSDSSQVNNFYQDCEQTLSELISFLNDKDQVVVANAADLVLKMSRNKNQVNRMIGTTLVETLVLVLATTQDLETARSIAEALHNISSKQEGLNAIFDAGGIRVLVELLKKTHPFCSQNRSPRERILNCAITTLHNLLLYQEGSKAAVRAAGGVQEMMSLLKNDNCKFLAIVTDCLQILAFGNQESKLIILAHNGPQELVRILKTFEYEKLVWTTSRALKVLSVCSSNKPAIVAAGGMQALAMHLGFQQTSRVLLNCLWALRNLSDAATKLDNLEELLRSVVTLVTCTDPSIVSVCAGILSNLTCNNHKNKRVVLQCRGVERLLHAICNANREEIKEDSVCALRHLTARHPDAALVQKVVGQPGNFNVILNILNQGPKWPTIKAVIGLIRNLSLNPVNQTIICDSGAIHKLGQILSNIFKDVLPNASGVPSPVVVDGVRMESIVQETLITINLMAKDGRSRAVLRQINIKNICIQLQHSNGASIKREAAEILKKLSMPEPLKKEEPNPMSPINDHINQESLSAYEGTMLLQISKEKSEERNDKPPNVLDMFRGDDAPMWTPQMAQMPPDFQDLINAPEGFEPMYGPPSVQNPPSYLGFDHTSMEPMSGIDMGPPQGCPGQNYNPVDTMELPQVHPPNLDYDPQGPPPPRKDHMNANAWHKCLICHQVYSSSMEAHACHAKHHQ